jgi:hypothetical protein
VGVLLGNGDGTFRPVVAYPSGGSSIPPFSSLLTVADVNGDGRPDLIVENSQCCGSANGVLGVLLGNGDGTFKKVVTYKSGAGGWGTSVAVADVNGDVKRCPNTWPSCPSGAREVQASFGRLKQWMITWERRLDFWPAFKSALA